MKYNDFIKEIIDDEPKMENELAFEKFLTELGRKIATKRKQEGLTQTELAKKMEIAQSLIAKYESGHNMTCQTLWKISKSLFLKLNIFGVDREEEEAGLAHFLETGKIKAFNKKSKTQEIRLKRTNIYNVNVNMYSVPSQTLSQFSFN